MKLEDIFTFEHLYEAHMHCRRYKQHKGEVIRFEMNLSVNLMNLVQALQRRTYQLGAYKSFYICEPKKRLIEALPYKDRVVVYCFCKYSLRSHIEKRLIYDNVACREGKGTMFAIRRFEQFLKREYLREGNATVYFLKCDIRKFFASIDHQVLFQQLAKLDFSDNEMWMIQTVISQQDHGAKKGLPLGNQTSQWFALFYLNRIDRLVKETLRVKHYIRYMDDMILLHRDKTYLQFCLKQIEAVCQNELHLELNQKTQIGKATNGVDFLGFRHILTKKGKVIRNLRTSSRIRMQRHVKKLNVLENCGIVSQDYVEKRKMAFGVYLKDSDESQSFQDKITS